MRKKTIRLKSQRFEGITSNLHRILPPNRRVPLGGALAALGYSILFCFFCAGALQAAIDRGAVRGTVTDPQGGVVPRGGGGREEFSNERGNQP